MNAKKTTDLLYHCRSEFRRYPRSIKNLFLYSEVCDKTLCFNNEQGNIIPVFERTKGQSIEIIDKITYSRIMEVVNNE